MSGASSDVPARLVGPVALALRGTPFEPRRMWPRAVVVARHNEPARAQLRGDFAGWAVANGLPSVARECLRRAVPSGRVLVWVELDVLEAAGARFFVFDFAAALAKAVP